MCPAQQLHRQMPTINKTKLDIETEANQPIQQLIGKSKNSTPLGERV